MGQRSGMQSIQRYEVHQVSHRLYSLEPGIDGSAVLDCGGRGVALRGGVRRGISSFAEANPNLSKFGDAEGSAASVLVEPIHSVSPFTAIMPGVVTPFIASMCEDGGNDIVVSGPLTAKKHAGEQLIARDSAFKHFPHCTPDRAAAGQMSDIVEAGVT